VEGLEGGASDGNGRETLGLERVNGFSDAVFAVAITLLILTIAIPKVFDTEQLGQQLVDMWPEFLGFFISFFIVGAFWIGHHSMFALLRRSTPGLLWINIVLLVFVVILPFSTDLMSEYNGSVVAVVFYDINMAAVALSLSFLWWYASYCHDLVLDSVAPAVRKHLLRIYLSMSLIFCLSIAIAFVNIPVSQYFYLTLIPVNIWLGRVHRKEKARNGQ
jgi:uncharacterized membrane protein